MSPYQTIIRWITPNEAKPIADKLLQSAQKIRQLAKTSKSVGESLQNTWTGGAKDSFFSQYSPMPSELEHYANLLENKAAAIAAISVWIKVQEWFEDKFAK